MLEVFFCGDFPHKIVACYHRKIIIFSKFTKGITMATNPIGKGTKTIGINMNKKMADELEKRANSMLISKSKYCKIILQQWLDSGKKLTLSEQK